MTAHLLEDVKNIIEKETGPLAEFIIKKECQKLGKSPDTITKDDIPALAKELTFAMHLFDDNVAKKLHDELLKLANGHSTN